MPFPSLPFTLAFRVCFVFLLTLDPGGVVAFFPVQDEEQISLIRLEALAQLASMHAKDGVGSAPATEDEERFEVGTVQYSRNKEAFLERRLTSDSAGELLLSCTTVCMTNKNTRCSAKTDNTGATDRPVRVVDR